MIDGQTQIYGVIGWPVGHTASPALHNAAFAQLGMNALYAAFATPPARLQDALCGMRGLGIAGLNVTVPHKRAVLPLLDELCGAAAELQSVNTIVRGDDGRLSGHNTDAAGFLAALREDGIDPAGAVALVYGAGGATPAVLHALREGGASEICIFNRTHSKAIELAAVFDAPGFRVAASDFSSPEIDNLYERANIIINATSIGLNDAAMPQIEIEKIRPTHSVVDIIYSPWETSLLRLARKKGARTVNGYGMLLHQAAAAFRLWTGHDAPIETMRRAGREFIGRRTAHTK